jgi:excisionase family DNA binding protein
MSLAFTVDEAIKESRIGRSSIFEAISDGRLKAKKFGRKTLILRDDLNEFLQALPNRAARHAA